MKVGKVYMIRGGLVLRYHGPWGDTGPCLAFQTVRNELSEPPTGYSAAKDDVLYEITAKDLHWIRDRREQCAARDLFNDVADMDALIEELEKAGG